MRLIACYVEGFGCLRKREYQFDGGLTQFFAENGEGKSTLAAFLKAMLYGLKSYRKGSVEFCDRERYYPFDGGKFGGNLTFSWRGKEYRVERFFGVRSETDDTLSVYENGERTGALGEEIGQTVLGVDKASFERTLFISGDDVEIGSTPCINAAFAGVTGGIEQSVSAAVEAIERAAKFYKKSKLGKDKITEQTQRIAKLNAEIDNAAAIRGALQGKYERLAAVQREIVALTERLDSAHKQSLREEQWEHYQELQRRIAQAEGQQSAILRRYPMGLPTFSEAQETRAAVQELDRLGETPTAERMKNTAIPVLFAAFALLLGLGVLCFLLTQIALGIICLCLGAAAVAFGFVAWKGEGRRRQAVCQKENELRQRKRELQAIVTGFFGRYGVTLPIEEILDDIKESARLSRELETLRAQAEQYRREKAIGEQPTFAREDGAALSAALQDRRREEARLLREIDADERQAERLEELESEKRAAMELLAAYQQKYKLLQAAAECLTVAERRLNERYVQPILEDFLAYAAVLECVLGEKIVMTREFELRFERGGEQRSERHFSAGQRALCALCFRLAVAKNLYRSRGAEQPFLILDDPFTALDEVHMSRAAVLIEELTKEWQVVYMVCHPSRKIEK